LPGQTKTPAEAGVLMVVTTRGSEPGDRLVDQRLVGRGVVA